MAISSRSSKSERKVSNIQIELESKYHKRDLEAGLNQKQRDQNIQIELESKYHEMDLKNGG